MAAGFGYQDSVTSKPFAIKVSDQVDYEIAFWFKQPTTDPTFEVSVKCFDCNLQTEFIPIDVRNGASNRILLPGNIAICGTPNKWNFFHGIVYSSNEPIHSQIDPVTSHAAGTNLIMKKGTAKLFVNVTCIKNCLLIWDFKVKITRTPFSTGFLGATDLVEIWRKNNKKDLTTAQIDTLANQFLLPYDTNLSVIEI